jgi:SAM-dependent methyltransferase
VNIRYFRYPQFLWARSIAAILARFAPPPLTIVDAPSGNGVVTYWLRRRHPQYRYILVDVSPDAIDVARHNIKSAGVTFVCADISDYLQGAQLGPAVLLLINSLYLLPEPDRLMLNIRSRFETVIGLFPHIDRCNFRAFVRKNPTFKHSLLLDRNATVDYFAQYSFHLIYGSDISTIHQHAIPKVRVLYPILVRCLNLVEPIWALANPEAAYWIGVFRRQG